MTGPRLWAIVGATGTGKSDLAIDLAEALREQGNPAEIVNADAMQLYRGMDVGTAKVPMGERRGVPHHLFDVLEVDEDAAVAWYQPRARAAVEDIHRRGGDAILVGGSGLYVSSVVFDFRFPPRDAELRERLERELETHGTAQLLERLRILIPKRPRVSIRVILVVSCGPSRCSSRERDTRCGPPRTSRPLASAHASHRSPRRPRSSRRAPRCPRGAHVGRRDPHRGGELRARGLERGTTAPRAIGYAQALAQLEGALTEPEAIAQTQALTRRYARRQVSWFKRYPDLEWWDAPAEAATLLRA